MKLQYKSIPSKAEIIQDLIFLEGMNFVFALCVLLFVHMLIPFPLYIFFIVLPVYGFLVFIYLERRADSEFYTFQDSGICSIRYHHIYVSILRNKEPETIFLDYRDIQECEIAYIKAEKGKAFAYDLMVRINGKQELNLQLQIASISRKSMDWLLSTLALHIQNLRDPYQLRLCLLQQPLAFDTYIYRIEGRNSDEDNCVY